MKQLVLFLKCIYLRAQICYVRLQRDKLLVERKHLLLLIQRKRDALRSKKPGDLA